MDMDQTYIPKSAKASDFKITLSNAAMENTERIEFLQHMVDQAKKAYEKTLKDVVQECIVLETNALKKEEREIISEMLYNIATATLTLSGSTCDPHLRVNNLIESYPSLFKYVAAIRRLSKQKEICQQTGKQLDTEESEPQPQLHSQLQAAA